MQHCWPEHAVKARDVLAHHMYLRRPGDLTAGSGIPGRCQVARQRVEPHVDRVVAAVARGNREGNSPAERRARDGHVLETTLDERNDLVIPTQRLNEFRMVFQMSQKKLLMRTQSKEPVRL